MKHRIPSAFLCSILLVIVLFACTPSDDEDDPVGVDRGDDTSDDDSDLSDADPACDRGCMVEFFDASADCYITGEGSLCYQPVREKAIECLRGCDNCFADRSTPDGGSVDAIDCYSDGCDDTARESSRTFTECMGVEYECMVACNSAMAECWDASLSDEERDVCQKSEVNCQKSCFAAAEDA
ncbi:MAG: hypothetical protein H6684_08910 [Deltaproteobacteria bacterium]|nr:hypothetical protein [Deltaproteobacteria bacterium]MCB9479600.1 hypothetical protein [Deltaproteobacteria bacterium]MCB9488836.1 hypothetical protein [Deltaproteobacteria bacterium]